VLQHFECEDAGVFGPALVEAGHAVEAVRLYEGATVPRADAFDGWLVMGGPMNVDEVGKYAWLGPERALLAELIAADRPVLGMLVALMPTMAALAPVSEPM
jgi:GMP synthase-like glutamine amidotransferase